MGKGGKEKISKRSSKEEGRLMNFCHNSMSQCICKGVEMGKCKTCGVGCNHVDIPSLARLAKTREMYSEG